MGGSHNTAEGIPVRRNSSTSSPKDDLSHSNSSSRNFSLKMRSNAGPERQRMLPISKKMTPTTSEKIYMLSEDGQDNLIKVKSISNGS
jgi:hypothetical protein